MKAQELMIGDWVICHHPTCEPKQIQVNAGLLNGLERQDLGFQTEESPLFRIVEPIPLTLEILQKNGFETDGEAIWASFCPEDKEFALEISEPNYYDENYGERGYWWTINACEYSIIPLRYVHELQHALKLCGIDKEIEL